jgi:hypothetical protein
MKEKQENSSTINEKELGQMSIEEMILKVKNLNNSIKDELAQDFETRSIKYREWFRRGLEGR